MMKKYQKTITVYELDGGFFVDVSKDEDVTHFYLGHKKYGIKDCMFGACDFYGMTEEELVLANVAEHIALYKEDYFDYDNMEEIN